MDGLCRWLELFEMPNRDALIRWIAEYQSTYGEELAFKKQFLELLEHPRAFLRDHLPGHITGSSWIVDRTGKFVLLTHHAKLNRWLQPGGHADGQEDVMAVAHREAYEETGLTSLEPAEPTIFDLDIHPIPARADFPEHLHYDIRFLFVANMDEAFTVTQESHDLAWILNEDIAAKSGNNISIMRMTEKAKRILG